MKRMTQHSVVSATLLLVNVLVMNVHAMTLSMTLSMMDVLVAVIVTVMDGAKRSLLVFPALLVGAVTVVHLVAVVLMFVDVDVILMIIDAASNNT
jgi:hypothetical protein